MANKQRLQGLITAPPSTPVSVPAGQSTVYPVGPLPQPDELALSPHAGALSTPLQEIARRFIGARRRSGEALLEAARWLHEARALAQHGEWGVFLDATGTSDDAAERLLNIHTLAMSDQRFADAVARNWLSQSVAADLARPSTPVEALDTLLEAEQPPTRAEAQRVIKQARASQHPHDADSASPQQPDNVSLHLRAGQNPHSADSSPDHQTGNATMPLPTGQNPHSADSSLAQQMDDLRHLQDAAATLTAVAQRAADLPRGEVTKRALEEITQAVAAIRQTLHL